MYVGVIVIVEAQGNSVLKQLGESLGDRCLPASRVCAYSNYERSLI